MRSKTNLFLLFKVVLSVCIFLVLSYQVNGQTVTIEGATTVCPNNDGGNKYIATAKLWGQEITCSWQWIISKDGFGIASGGGRIISNYSFTDVGTYKIQFFAVCNTPYTIETVLFVTSRVKLPNPIVPVTAPSMCNPGQVYTFKTDPALDYSDTTCLYHYEYLWVAPPGWSISGGTNGHGASVDIVAPTNTPSGNYTISVQSTIPNGQPGPFPNNRFLSTPRNYSVRVGNVDSSQIYVTGTTAVCNGNTYTYTAVVPGGHQNGYSYNWYFPSGWSVQSTNANTITLYVPTYNNSYGPVRFSVDIGCGATGFSGITTFPCNYMNGNFMIYPNPSESELNVDFILTEDLSTNQNEDSKTETTKNSPIEKGFRVELYDKDQKLVKTGNSSKGKIKMDTNNLKPGNYFLYIYFEKEVLTQQIIVR